MAAVVALVMDWLATHLPALLLLYWGLASFAAVVALQPLPFASGFRSAVILSACRGKLLDEDAPRALGPLADWTVPQRWFGHFYALGSLWALAVVALLLPALPALPPAQQAAGCLGLGLALLHLLRRWGETEALMRYPPGSRMHGIAYVFGLSYYLVMPVTLLPATAYVPMSRLALRLLHGKAPGAPALPPLSTLAAQLTRLQLVGVAAFAGGSLLQHHSHRLLAALAPAKSVGKPTYRIPKGGAFELVSCPHYLGECVVYLGLALAAGPSRLAPWLMLLWVAANLLLAAGMTQRWYRRHFKAYPRSRAALIPCIY